MNERPAMTVVPVVIAGEEYTVRTHATPEHTRECAAHVDRAIAEILRQGTLVEGHKAAILAAMSLANQLLQARARTEALREQVAQLARRLAADVEERTAAEDLAPLL